MVTFNRYVFFYIGCVEKVQSVSYSGKRHAFESSILSINRRSILCHLLGSVLILKIIFMAFIFLFRQASVEYKFHCICGEIARKGREHRLFTTSVEGLQK